MSLQHKNLQFNLKLWDMQSMHKNTQLLKQQLKKHVVTKANTFEAGCESSISLENCSHTPYVMV
jgi:hypothetical protein